MIAELQQASKQRFSNIIVKVEIMAKH